MSTEIKQFIFTAKGANTLYVAQTFARICDFGKDAWFNEKHSFSSEALDHIQVEAFHPETVNAYLSDIDNIFAPDIVVWRMGRLDPFQPRRLTATDNYQVTLGDRAFPDQEQLTKQAKKAIEGSLRSRIMVVLDNVCVPYKDMGPAESARIYMENRPSWFPFI